MVAKKIVKKVKPGPKPKVKPAKPKVISPASKTRNKTTSTSTSTSASAASVKAAEQKAREKAVIAAGAGAFGLAGLTGAMLAAARKDKNKSGKTFDDAFRTARNKGEGTKFTFNGKSYVAVTKDDLKKKGYSSLAEYNRAGGKKKIDIDAAAKKIVSEVNKNKPPKPTETKAELTRKQKRRQRRKERIGFETFKERRQARRAKRKAAKNPKQSGFGFKSGGIVSSKKSTPRGVGAAKRGFGKALR